MSFAYYALLSAKTWNWLFASQDSGDWLAGAIWWMNVQPFGSPLFVLLGKLVYSIMPDNLVVGMTLLLSALPASITVAVTYLIAKKLTGQRLYGFISALVLLGAAIFLTQATILEEYAIASMFVTLALWSYINDKKKLTVLFLGLGSAIHVIVVFIAIIWLCLHLKQIKVWLKHLYIYVAVGLLPYLLVPAMMYLPTPKLLAGNLSLESFNSYLGSSSTIGSISWYEFLFRVPQAVGIFAVSLGLALIPLIFGLRKKSFNKPLYMMAVTICFGLWLYLTNTDPSTWTFMCFSLPMITVLVSIGLQNLPAKHTVLVFSSAVVLITVNAFFLNANILAQQYPVATNFERAVKNLPDGSAIVTCSGGPYGLGTIYLMAQGKDVVPIYYTGQEPDNKVYASESDKANMTAYVKDARYTDYKAWIAEHYQIYGENTQAHVANILIQNRQVYLLLPTVTPYWQDVFETEPYNELFAVIKGVK